MKDRLNESLIDGVCVLDIIPSGRKIRDLSLLCTQITMHYDAIAPENVVPLLAELFSRDSVIVEKKTKRDVQEQNIISMIHSVDISAVDSRNIVLNVLHCCQNPTLNPTQITAAITKYLPELTPDVCKYRRLEAYDCNKNVFR